MTKCVNIVSAKESKVRHIFVGSSASYIAGSSRFTAHTYPFVINSTYFFAPRQEGQLDLLNSGRMNRNQCDIVFLRGLTLVSHQFLQKRVA